MKLTFRLKGGSGSGNFGHAGRPGKVGGSDSNGTDTATGSGWNINGDNIHSRKQGNRSVTIIPIEGNKYGKFLVREMLNGELNGKYNAPSLDAAKASADKYLATKPEHMSNTASQQARTTKVIDYASDTAEAVVTEFGDRISDSMWKRKVEPFIKKYVAQKFDMTQDEFDNEFTDAFASAFDDMIVGSGKFN